MIRGARSPKAFASGVGAGSETHAAASLRSALLAAVAIANTETVVVSIAIPANTLAAGDTFMFRLGATQVGSNAASPVFRMRMGPTTLIGNSMITLTGVAGSSTGDTWAEGTFTIRTGLLTGIGVIMQSKEASNAADQRTTVVALDPTVANLVELTFASGHADNTYTIALAEIWKASA